MRTPLTAVNLLLTSLAGHVDEESRGDVRALRRQVARMDWLVESLLKLAKLDAGTARFCPETIPLSALLARAAEPFAHRHGAARPAAAGRGVRKRPL